MSSGITSRIFPLILSFETREADRHALVIEAWYLFPGGPTSQWTKPHEAGLTQARINQARQAISNLIPIDTDATRNAFLAVAKNEILSRRFPEERRPDPNPKLN